VATAEYEWFIEGLNAYLALDQTSHVLDVLLESVQQGQAVGIGRHAYVLWVGRVVSEQ
jgi:hypothetical protein